MPKRNLTCLVKAVSRSDYYFHDKSALLDRQLVLISDMLEDCHGVGDPGDIQTLQKRLELSLKDFPVKDLTGVELFGLCPNRQINMEVASVRSAWQKALLSSHPKSLTIQPKDIIVSEKSGAQR